MRLVERSGGVVNNKKTILRENVVMEVDELMSYGAKTWQTKVNTGLMATCIFLLLFLVPQIPETAVNVLFRRSER